MDVLIVGAGPAGLACAIELARLVKRDQETGGGMPELNIGVLEKAESLGEHSLSGAVVNPRAFRELFPDLQPSDFPFRQPVPGEAVYFMTGTRAQRIPTPPTMHNAASTPRRSARSSAGSASAPKSSASTCSPGFPVDALLVDGDAVRGVRTTPSGLDRDGAPGPGLHRADRPHRAGHGRGRGNPRARWGRRGASGRQVGSPNPQLFALGVKELWEVEAPARAP